MTLTLLAAGPLGAADDPALRAGPEADSCLKDGLGCEAWAMRYDAAGNLDDSGALAVSPDGAVVFVTGHSLGDQGYDAATMAYDAATGARRWLARYNGPDGAFEEGTGLVVAPDGSTVFVALYSESAADEDDAVIVAYDAATGAERWVMRFDGPAHGLDRLFSVARAPDGDGVVAAGVSDGSGTDYDLLVLSVSAGGALRWATTYDGPPHGQDFAWAVGAAPGGDAVFAAGRSDGPDGSQDALTLALDASTGAVRWVRRQAGAAGGLDEAVALAAHPGGASVLVAAAEAQGGTDSDVLLLAYDAATGASVWVGRYAGPPGWEDRPTGLALSPDAATAYVSGWTGPRRHGEDALTLAFDTTTGAERWRAIYAGSGGDTDQALAVAADPTGERVVVTGWSIEGPPLWAFAPLLGLGVGSAWDVTTLVYDAATGLGRGQARYQGPGNNNDQGRAVGVSPDGTRAFVTGYSHGGTVGFDYATLAYDLERLVAP